MHLSLPYLVLNIFFSYLAFSAYSFFFFYYKSENKIKNTFVVLVDVLDDNWLLLLLFKSVGCIVYGIGLVKLIVFLLVNVSSDCASGQFLELIPVVY